MPALYKDPKSAFWYFDIQIKGQRLRGSTRTKDRKEAQAYLEEIRRQHYSAVQLNRPADKTWMDAVAAWMALKPRHLSDCYRLRELEHWAALPLSSITRQRIAEHLATKAPGTAKRHYNTLRAVLNLAHDNEWCGPPPKLKLPSADAPRTDWLTAEEFQALLPLLPPHTRQMARFAVATGLRRHNVTHLCWSAVDLSRRVMWVHHDESKSGKAIAVPLNADAMTVLAERQGVHTMYVFTYRERPITQVATKAWRKAVKAIGRPGFTFHGLRHTWASWAVMAGVPLEVVQKLGGWSTLEMVQRYAKLAPGYLSSYAEKVRPYSAVNLAERD